MTSRITNRQMFFIIFLTLTTYASIDIPKHMAQTAGRSSWIPILISSVIYAFAAVIITKLNNMHQEKVFFDYSKEIVGLPLSRIICCYYLIFFLIAESYLKLKLIGVLKSNFLPDTPHFITLIVGILLFGFIAYKGVTNIARMFEIVGVLFLAITSLMCFVMLLEGMHYNILPFFNISEVPGYAGAMKSLITPFSGLSVLFIIPFTAKNKNAPKVAFATLIFIGLFYVLIVESTIMMLGINNTITYNDSFIEAIKIVELPILERTDIFFLTFGLTSLFAGIIIVFTAILDFVCRLFPKVKRIVLVIIIQIFNFILSMLAIDFNNFRELFEQISPYLAFISCIFIPLVLFVIANTKKKFSQKPLKGGSNNEEP